MRAAKRAAWPAGSSAANTSSTGCGCAFGFTSGASTQQNSPRLGPSSAKCSRTVARRIVSKRLVSSRHTSNSRAPAPSAWSSANVCATRWGASKNTTATSEAKRFASALRRAPALAGRNPSNRKPRRGYRTCRQRRGDGRGAGHGRDANAGRPRVAHQRKARIRHQRRAGVRHQRHGVPGEQVFENAGARLVFVVIVQGQQHFRLGADVRQQAAAPSGIFAGHHARRPEHIRRSQRQVLQVPYGCRHHIQPSNGPIRHALFLSRP